MKHTINLNSRVVVTDPCFEYGIWCQKELHDVLPGDWNVVVRKSDQGAWGTRIASITIRHEDYPKGRIDSLAAVIGVDSGQAGIFNADYFERNQPDNDFDNVQSWYRRVCELTINEPCWGTIDGLGAVAASGFGDGSYGVFVGRNSEGKIVGIRIQFI